MLDEKLCPHLVLGMRSDQPSSDAARWFAAASRRVKSASAAPFTIENLTAALSAVEAGSHTDNLWFRLPCDPGAILSAPPSKVGDVATSTRDEALSAVGAGIGDGERDLLGRTMLYFALEGLLAWEFDQALTLSTESLRLSREEQVRDEALNLMAAAHCMLGSAGKAVAALEHAVEGEWNLSLQCNLAIVATDEKPELAVTQMRYLIDSAPDAQAKLGAALRAIGLWRAVQTDLTGSDDSDDHEEIPSVLLTSIHSLLGHSGLTEEQFFSLGMFLAVCDPDGLQKSQAFKTSSYRAGPSGQLIAHRCSGFSEYLENLVRLARRAGSSAPFIEEKVEEVVQQVNAVMADDENLIGAGIALKLIEQGLDVSTAPRIILRSLLTFKVAQQAADAGNVPKSEFIGWMREAKNAIGSVAAGSGSELTEFLVRVTNDSGNFLAAVYVDHFADLIREVAPLLDAINQQMSGFLRRMGANRQAIGDASRNVLAASQEALGEIPLLMQIASEPELKNQLGKVRDILKEFEKAARQWA